MDEIIAFVNNAKTGDENAFSALLDKYQGLIFSISVEYSNMCPEPLKDQEDFLQEAKIAFFNAVKTYDESKKITFGAYAKICIRNRLISCVRKINSKKRKMILTSVTQPEQDTVLKNTLSNEQRQQIFNAAKQSLSRFEYAIFELYFLGMRAKEISVKINKTEKSINNAIYRMKLKLSTLVDNDT